MENEVISQELENQELKLPYLIFKISDVLYAVNGETINTIFVLDQPVTRVPMTGSHVRGIINVRGEVVPLVDIRIMFDLKTMDEEHNKFCSMLSKRKEDHLNWVNALDEAVENKTEFKLATDHHKCKFGQWYDSFEPTNNDIQYYLKQIADPHEKLHALAQRALNAETKEEAKQLVKLGKEEYVPKLLELITQMGKAHISATKQMVVILQKDKTQIGIIVDEVMEVTDIEEVCSLDEVSSVHHSRFVRGVGNSEQYDKDILLIDVDQIVNVSGNAAVTA